MGIGIALGLFVAASLAPATTMRSAHPPEVEQQLAFLVNDWTIEGFENKYRETCSWWQNRSFVICETLDETEGAPVRSVSIFGWSSATKNFTYHHYAQDGRSRSETCFANAKKGLTCLGERRTDKGLVQSRSHIWPDGDAAPFRSERSQNGGPWTEVLSIRYVPRRK